VDVVEGGESPVDAVVSLQISGLMTGYGAPVDGTGGVAACLERLRHDCPRSDLLRAGLLGQVRDADTDQARRELLCGYVEPVLEVVALMAVAAAPQSMRPMDAVAEANVIFVGLVQDASVPDPLLALADSLQATLRRITSST
jgi:hypothetical protein